MSNKDYFPDSDVWAAAIPHARENFAAVADSKPAALPGTRSVEQEFRAFVALDLSNM